MKTADVLLSLLLSLFLLLSFAAAEDGPRVIIIDRSVNIDFVPVDGFFLLESEGMPVERVKAVLLAYDSGSGLAAGARSRWLAGAKVVLPQAVKSFNASLVLLGRQNRFEYFSAVNWDLERRDTFQAMPELLKARLLQKRKVLEGLDAQQNRQQQSLKRLQDDADVIGGIGRIVDVQDQAERLRQEISSMDRDLESLKYFLQMAGNQPAPRARLRRETELTRSLGELSDAVRKAETGMAARRSEAEGEVRRKLELIEMARYEDPEMLKQQLLELRRRRMQLEKETGIVSDAPQILIGGKQ